MTRLEKFGLACLIIQAAYYVEAVGWTKEVSIACMFICAIGFVALGGKDDSD